MPIGYLSLIYYIYIFLYFEIYCCNINSPWYPISLLKKVHGKYVINKRRKDEEKEINRLKNSYSIFLISS